MDEVKSAEVGDVEFSEGGSRVWEAAQTEARTRGYVVLRARARARVCVCVCVCVCAMDMAHRFKPPLTHGVFTRPWLCRTTSAT